MLIQSNKSIRKEGENTRVTDYKKITELNRDDILLLDSIENGTRTIFVSDLAKQLNKVLYNSSVSTIPVPLRRKIYRGKYLGDVITDAQREKIRDGSFDDMYPGDYWIIHGRVWRIADFDTWIRTRNGQNEPIETHHVVLINEQPFSGYNMNDTNTSSGGWYNSKMFNVHLDSILNQVINDFGSQSIMSHPRNQLDGRNHQVQIDIPTCAMVTGTNINSANVTIPYSCQLAYASLDPEWFSYCSLQDSYEYGFYCIFSLRELTKQEATGTNFWVKVMICVSGGN